MPNAQAAANDPAGINQVVYLDGGKREFAEPVPISPMDAGLSAVPAPMVVAGYGRPGMPAPGPIAGVGGTPVWGMPITGTPIGLPGPPSVPFGADASLQSHTIRNLTANHLPQPVDHMLIDVKETPGYSVPPPVKHIEYTEEHPVFGEGEVVYPKWALPEGGPGGAACPPGTPMPPGGMPQQ
jgi:hypothetical protein